MRAWFIDTGFVIALSAPKDNFHTRAAVLAQQIARDQIPLVTTYAVLLEIGAALSKLNFRVAAAQLLQSLYNDAHVQILPNDAALTQSSLDLFAQRPDKEWSLCDCTSFVVMQNLKISSALTTDHHFSQAGFSALLLQEQLTH